MTYELVSSNWTHEELDAIQRVITSDRYTMGSEVDAFESDFARYHGRAYGVMTNSGSSANLIATASLFYRSVDPLQRGDEAIVPALSWSTMYHPLHQYGLKQKIVDIELDTLNVDVAQLEQAITPATKLIVAVSILGNPAALDVMRRIADERGIAFLEDNCESADAELGGRKTGTFGDVSTFSFFFSHHIATMEGGMVLTDDEETFHLLRSLRAHGWTRDLPAGSSLFEPSADDRFEAYRFILPGYNVRPTEFAGAIGRVQLGKLAESTAARRRNLTLFRTLFEGDERFIIQRENGKSSCFSFTIVLNPDRDIDRNRVFAGLDDAGIRYRIITGGCILRHDVVKHYDHETFGTIRDAYIAHDNGFFVGNHPADLERELNGLRAVLDRVA